MKGLNRIQIYRTCHMHLIKNYSKSENTKLLNAVKVEHFIERARPIEHSVHDDVEAVVKMSSRGFRFLHDEISRDLKGGHERAQLDLLARSRR